MKDIYSPSLASPWWSRISYPFILKITSISAIAFMGSSYIVLINFYLTSLHNTGKYPVVYSCMRKFISSIHQTFLGLFMIFYFALLVLFAVWTLLGAILNPAKFLP